MKQAQSGPLSLSLNPRRIFHAQDPFFSLALMAAFSAASASAADVTEDLMISATVNNECSLLVTQLGGGEYNGLASGTQGYSNGALMVRCNQGTAFSIVPGDGLNYGRPSRVPITVLCPMGPGTSWPTGCLKTLVPAKRGAVGPMRGRAWETVSSR